MKIWMITGGGDWADASAQLVAADGEVDMEKELAAHREWYRDRYLPALRAGEKPTYLNFEEWLLVRGLVRKPKPEEAEEFYDA